MIGMKSTGVRALIALAAIMVLANCDQGDPLARPLFAQSPTAELPKGADSGKADVTAAVGVDVAAAEEFRVVMLRFASSVERLVGSTHDLDIGFSSASPEQLHTLRSAIADPVGFEQNVDTLEAIVANLGVTPAGPTPRGAPCMADNDFPPPYPTGSTYETFVDTLDNLGHLVDTNQPGEPGFGRLNDERCKADSEAGLSIGFDAATIAAIAAQTVCDTIVVFLGEGTNAPACIIAGGLNEAAFAIGIVLQQCSLQDALVDSAEIEAAYENTVCILDAVTCRPVAAQRKGHGCNGNDDDCDKMVDECDEDVFGPDMYIDVAVTIPWYGSNAEASAAVARAVVAIDDCSAVTIDPPVLVGTCDMVVASVSASDACGNTSTASTMVRVDGTPPVATCSVLIDELSPGNHEMIDVGFSYTATDNCPGDLDLAFHVTSDERTASASGAGQASPAPDAEILRTLDGMVHRILIRAERSSAGNGRVYRIYVIATDPRGNQGTATCDISVPPNGNAAVIDDGQFFDATRVN